jgi:hypothetical protein
MTVFSFQDFAPPGHPSVARSDPAWRERGGTPMNLPKIDLSALPDLENITGMFGTYIGKFYAQETDDSVVILMTFLYDIMKKDG